MIDKLYMVVLIIWALNPTAAAKSRLELTRAGAHDRNRTQRDVSCREGLEYPHDNICCLNCPAGTYVRSSCTRASEKGTCEPCDFDTYTEHDNDLNQCFKCTKCRSDQEITRRCTKIQDTECQCKSGLFCAPDQACEVCRKCTRCKEGEVQVRNCTSTSNTVCKRAPSTSITITAVTGVIVPGVILLIAVVAVVYKRKLSKRTGIQNHPTEMEKVVVDDEATNQSMEERQNVQNAELDDYAQVRHPLLEPEGQQAVGAKASCTEDEDKGLGDSLPNTTNSSQSSLSARPSTPLPRSSSPRPSPVLQRQPDAREKVQFRKLLPLNGDESLKKCFEYFEEIDVGYHNRFFRHIGLHDNAIKSRDHLPPEEKVYELLTVWMEKVGMKADMNDLIKALLHFNQRLSAENIIEKAIKNAYYQYEEE